jgi:hypothetical protein
MNGLNATYEGRLNYLTRFLGDGFTKPGSVYVGGYNVWTNGNRVIGGNFVNTALNRASASVPIGRRDNLSALYAGWNQEWFRGIGTAVNYMFSPAGSTNRFINARQTGTGANAAFINEGIAMSVRQALTAVVNVPMCAIAPGFRDKDAFGVGYGFIDLFNDGLGGSGYNKAYKNSLEQVAEVYYRFQLNDSISVVPSYQAFLNRAGLQANGFTNVIALRTNFLF